MAIQIIDGFQVNTSLPIDNRIVASGSSARNAIPYKYHGLRVFDISNNIPYVWNGSSWVSENASGIVGSGTSNFFPLFTSSNVVGDSFLYQDGGVIKTGDDGGGSDLVEISPYYGTVTVQGGFVGPGTSITNISATNITTGTLPLSRLQGVSSTGQIIVAGPSSPAWTNPSQLSVGTSSFATTASNVKLSTSSGASNYIPFVNNTNQSALYVDTSFVYDDIYNDLMVGSIRLGSTTGLTMSFRKVNYGSFTAQNTYSGVSANMTVGYVKVPNSINFKVEATFVGYTSAPFSGGGFASATNKISSFYKVSSSGVLTQINTATTDNWSETYASGMTTYYAYGGSLSDSTNQLIFISSHTSGGSYYAQATVSYKITVI